MAAYRARMIDALTPGESTFEFEARDDLMSDTPVRVVRGFFETVPMHVFPVAHTDWEVNAAFKSPDRTVACVMGVLHRKQGAPLPFAVFVSAKAGEPQKSA